MTVPLPRDVTDAWRVLYWAPSTYLRGHLAVHGLALCAIAASMLLQPGRYTAATSLGLRWLAGALTPQEWGLVFVAVGVTKLAAFLVYPRLALPTLLAGMALVTWWAAGYAAAWLWGGATILGAIAWVLLVGEHVAALTMLDGSSRRRWR